MSTLPIQAAARYNERRHPLALFGNRPMLRKMLCAFLLLAITLPCQAQGGKAKPNTLTPQEIADGWILLFDGETTFGWSTNGEPLKVNNGLLEISGGTKATKARPTVIIPSYEVAYEYSIRDGSGGFVLQYGEKNSEYWLGISRSEERRV